MSLNIMSQRENGFHGFGSQPGSTTASEPFGSNSRGNRSYVSDSHLLLYSKPRGCQSRHIATNENHCFCTVTGVGLASGYNTIILNSVSNG